MTREEIRNDVANFIKEALGEAAVAGINDDTSLIDGRILDSIITLQMISSLEEKYKLDIAAHEITPENLDTINKITDFVMGKLS